MGTHLALSWLLALLVCMADIGHAQPPEMRLIVAGPDWRPSAELQAVWLRRTPSNGCSLSFGDSEPLELNGVRLSVHTLAGTPENPWNEARERELTQRLEQAELIELHGGTWLAWWQHCLPDKKPSRLLQTLHAAQQRGALLIARGEAARFAAGGIVMPDETGRYMRGPQAQTRPWCLAGYLVDVPLLLEYEDQSDDSRGAGRVLYAAARELRLAGGREVERAWVVQRAGAVALDQGGTHALVLDLPVLRLGFESMRKASTREMSDVTLTVLEPAAPREPAWQAWLTRPASQGLAVAMPQPAPVAQDMRMQTLLSALRSPPASVHADRYGVMERCAGSSVVRWRALPQATQPAPR